MDVSKNRGTPKWMVYNGKPYFLIHDLGGFPIFLVQHPNGMNTGNRPKAQSHLIDDGETEFFIKTMVAEIASPSHSGCCHLTRDASTRQPL